MRNKRGLRSNDDDLRDPNLLAAGLLTDAKVYLKAARALAAQEIWSPEYFLLCHAIELILKSYLASHGATERELKQLRHELLRMYSRARKKDCLGHFITATSTVRISGKNHRVTLQPMLYQLPHVT